MKSCVPSEIWNILIMQAQVDPRWVFPQHAVQMLSVERFLFPITVPFTLCNKQSYVS